MKNNKFVREVGCVFADDDLVDISVGTASENVSDFFKVKDVWKNKKFKTLTIIHTHPPKFNNASEQDNKFMKAWSLAFPVPIWFGIVPCDSGIIHWYLSFNKNIIDIGESTFPLAEISYASRNKMPDDEVIPFLSKRLLNVHVIDQLKVIRKF